MDFINIEDNMWIKAIPGMTVESPNPESEIGTPSRQGSTRVNLYGSLTQIATQIHLYIYNSFMAVKGKKAQLKCLDFQAVLSTCIQRKVLVVYS